MDKKQVEAIADAMMQPEIARQPARRKRREVRNRASQAWVGVSLWFMALGSALRHFAHASIFYCVLFGITGGILLTLALRRAFSRLNQ